MSAPLKPPSAPGGEPEPPPASGSGGAPGSALGSTPRLEGLDVVKGLAIILVVLIHAAPEEDSAYRAHVVQGVARLAVPLFLVVSGFLAGWKDRPPATFRAYTTRYLRLHVTYALFYWALDEMAGTGPRTLREVLLQFGAGAWPGQFFFVVLVQIFLLSALVLPRAYWQRPRWVAGLGLLALAGTGALVASRVIADPDPVLRTVERLRENPFWLWIYYFALGGFLGSRAGGKRSVPGARLASAALAAGLAIAAFDHLALPEPGGERALAYARPSIFVAASLCAWALPAAATGLRGRASRLALGWASRLGRESFTVFVLNPAILGGIFALAGRPASGLTSVPYAVAAVAVGYLLARPLRRWAPWLVP